MPDPVTRLNAALEGRYRVERELGEGGMATVYLAEDLKHGRKVALKVLRPELAESLGAERFLREIRISAQLNHPNILTLIDSGRVDGLMYYVLPYVEGESLRDRLRREGQLPVEDALRITRESADALGYAHGRGIVHRDVKPENILIESGHAVVADFGIAHAVSEAGGEKLTASGLAVGTPAYMSPEQATADERVDARSDIYSLACVLYEMLAGAPPFSGPTPLAILARKAVESVPGLRVVRETVPPALETAVLRALARVPADRFATAEAFVEALEGHSATAATARLPGLPRGRWAGAALVIVVVAAAAYLFQAIARRGDSRSDLAGATFAQVTVAPGVEWFPSFSPDGQWIVYSGEASGNRDIYLQGVGGQKAIDLTRDSPVDDDQPAFSPDGERIAFRSERNGGGIFVMGRTGEAPHRVTREGFRPTWSPDAKRIAFSTGNVDQTPENGPGGKLWVADVATGETRRVTELDATMPSWSPHGARIAFAHSQGQIAHVHVWTVPADGGEAVPATDGSARDWSPAWSADGRYLYFVSDRGGGSMNLWRERIDENSGRPLGDPEAVTAGGSTSLVHVALAADGRHIAYSSLLTTNNVQRSAFDPVGARMVGDPEWITRGSRMWSDPEPSPDGRNVAFTSYSEPVGDIYVMPTDGPTDPRQLTEGAKYNVPRWSPDGRWITAWSKQTGSVQMWKVHPDGSGLTQVTDAGFAAYGVWSRDATRMVVGMRGAAGRVTILFDPNRPWHDQEAATLSTPPDSLTPFSPHSWSPDGARLAGMISEDDRGIVTYTFASRTYERLIDFGQWPVWLPDGRRILFVTGKNAFYVVDRVTGDVRSVFSVGRGDVIGPPGLTPDGRMVYYARRHTEADIWVMTLHRGTGAIGAPRR